MSETNPQIEAFGQMIVAAANTEHALRSALIQETRRANVAEARCVELAAERAAPVAEPPATVADPLG